MNEEKCPITLVIRGYFWEFCLPFASGITEVRDQPISVDACQIRKTSGSDFKPHLRNKAFQLNFWSSFVFVLLHFYAIGTFGIRKKAKAKPVNNVTIHNVEGSHDRNNVSSYSSRKGHCSNLWFRDIAGAPDYVLIMSANVTNRIII